MQFKEAIKLYKKEFPKKKLNSLEFQKWRQENKIILPVEGATKWEVSIVEEGINNVEMGGLRAGRIELWRNGDEDVFVESHIVLPAELYEKINQLIN